LSEGETLEETKAKMLMTHRNYKILERDEQKNFVRYLVKISKEDAKAIMWCMLNRETVGVRYINQLKKDMDTSNAAKGIIVSSGSYSYAAKAKSKRESIELIPKTFPHFDIFKHVLVPKHEILSVEERNKILKKYRVSPHQLPWIMHTDPAVIAIGAVPGDIVKIIRGSPTAGKYTSYRFVIEE
jgi:DNA-directed RNA polymerase subunit H